MKQQKPMMKESGCGDCPAYRGPDVTGVRVQNVTAIPSQMVEQTEDGIWHALLTSVGKGKFLIRRRKNPAAKECPLLSYDIRHIEEGDGEGHKPDPQTAGSPAGNRASREACRKLLMLVLMGRI